MEPPQPLTKNLSQKRRRWQLAGVGVLGCLLPVIALFAAVVGAFLDFSASLNSGACHDSAEYYRNALMMYAQDYDERLPPSNRWADTLFPYTKLTYDVPCPSRPNAIGPYAFNAALDRRLLAKVNAKTPLLFESNAGHRNHSDLLQSFARPHKGKGWIVLGDGACRSFDTPPDAGLVK